MKNHDYVKATIIKENFSTWKFAKKSWKDQGIWSVGKCGNPLVIHTSKCEHEIEGHRYSMGTVDPYGKHQRIISPSLGVHRLQSVCLC